jgi:hypothetical protein
MVCPDFGEDLDDFTLEGDTEAMITQNFILNFDRCNTSKRTDCKSDAEIDKLWNFQGTTLVSHNSETITDVGNCVDPGCYSKSIIYTGATTKQLAALVDLSTNCRQYFRVI